MGDRIACCLNAFNFADDVEVALTCSSMQLKGNITAALAGKNECAVCAHACVVLGRDGAAVLRDSQGALGPARPRRCQGWSHRLQDRRPRGRPCKGVCLRRALQLAHKLCSGPLQTLNVEGVSEDVSGLICISCAAGPPLCAGVGQRPVQSTL